MAGRRRKSIFTTRGRLNKQRKARQAQQEKAAAKAVEAAAAANQPPRQKTQDDIIIERLNECFAKLIQYNTSCKDAIKIWTNRYNRLEYYHIYLVNESKKRAFEQTIRMQTEKYNSEMQTAKSQERMVRARIEVMKEQRERLKRVHSKIALFHGCAPPVWAVELENPAPTLNELNAALNEMPKLDLICQKSPEPIPLLGDDLGIIEWPSVNPNYEMYYEDWNFAHRLAAECRELHGQVIYWSERVGKCFSKYHFIQENKAEIQLCSNDPRKMCGDYLPETLKLFKEREELEKLIRKSLTEKARVVWLRKEEQSLLDIRAHREKTLKDIRDELNLELFQCTICLESMTNGQKSRRCPKMFPTCGHTVCATCMPNFRTQLAPHNWQCPECRSISSVYVTNWALMKMIKPIETCNGFEIITLD